MEMTLYCPADASHCPKCKILKFKLDKLKLKYEEKYDPDFLKRHNYFSYPAMEINGEPHDYMQSINWVNDLSIKKGEIENE